ncbi:MAG: WD40 repeat domain-containing protein, partial [Helicobacter sp.]|nr:WD40 repeat domain-containing protein [Helicobacter sp.]
ENKVIDKYLQFSNKLEPLYHFSKSVAISYETSKMVVGLAKNNEGIVLGVGKNIAPIASLTWQKLPISNIIFSLKDRYIAVGGQDGRVLVYFGENCQLLTAFPPVSDTISSLGFSDDEVLLFAGSFNKSAFIVNLLKNVQIAFIDFNSVVEDVVFYDKDTKIFCVTRDGKTITYDILKKEIIRENFLGKYWFTITRKLPNGDFALVGGRDNILRIVELSSNTLIDSIVLGHTGVTSMLVSKNILYMGYSDGVIEIVDIDEAKEEMLKALEANDLKGAMKIIQEKNVFLQLLNEYTIKVETLWKETLGKAIDLLAKNNIDEATILVEPFMYDKEKKEEFDYYWQQKESVAKFMDAIEAKNYAEAYILAQQHPYIQNTVAYEELESLWEKCFSGAKKLLVADHKLNFPKAQALLKSFANVKSKKETIIMLLNNTDKFLQAEVEYKEKNYAEYFKICEKFSFLKETAVYRNALYIGEQLS